MANHNNLFVQYLSFDSAGNPSKQLSLAKLEAAFSEWYVQSQENAAEVREAVLTVLASASKPVPLPELAQKAWQVTGHAATELSESKWTQRVSDFVRGQPSLFHSQVGRNGGIKFIGDRSVLDDRIPAAAVETVVVETVVETQEESVENLEEVEVDSTDEE